MSSITQYLSEIFGKAMVELGLPQALGEVRTSDRPDLADFQCNGAMASAKIARKPPREIAKDIVSKIKLPKGMAADIDIEGPGFINIKINNGYLSDFLSKIANEDRCGIKNISDGANIIIDYGGPNVAKSMHVGHLRSSIIGESIKRAYSYMGYNAIGDIHLGDWGTQMGMVISELEINHPDWLYFDKNFKGDYPKESPITITDLEEIYPKASQACKSDEARMEIAKNATVELQSGNKGYTEIWKHMVSVSVKSMEVNFDALDVQFELWNGESTVHDIIAPMVDDLIKNKWAIKSEGATVIPVAKNSDKKEFPPLMIYKSDGAVMYGTTDLATIKQRMDDYNPEKMIYVVDQRQGLHFEQVFRAARICKIAPDDDNELLFIGYGTMNGIDGKPFKTRAGGVMKLEDLINMGKEKATSRLLENNLAADIDEEERNKIADMISIAAIKFADLQNNPVSDYIFDINRMTSFEGKTGPYLLYQAVRIKSLMVKAADNNYLFTLDSINVCEENRTLCLILASIEDVLVSTTKNNSPNILCDYLYKMAQEFSSFYGRCHILSEENESLRISRLAICALALKQLQIGLKILGIKIPDRM